MPFWSPSPAESTRRTQYAGSWYENNPAKLKQELDDFLARAQTNADFESKQRVRQDCAEIKGELLAIIVPHAGYMFSGATAAFAYKAASGRKVKRIFLLGPSHHVGFRGAALPDTSMFATPLGELEIDKEMIAELKSYQMFATMPEVHRVEHSLELQLPFIKHCFKDVKIVPVVIGQIDGDGEARMIGEILKGFVETDDLVVVSSDFTHYGPRYDYMPFGLDADVPEKICEMDGAAFSYLSEVNLDGFVDFLDKTEDTICGMYPCQVLLAMMPAGAHGTLLKYSTSRDSHIEDKSNSVSYLAIAFSGASWPEAPSTVRDAKEVVKLTDAERQDLLKLALGTIEVFVKENRQPTPEELGVTITPAMKECFGVFVTLHKNDPDQESEDHKELRGCIGSIYPTKQLYSAVQENAVSSCSRDYRFPPVAASELAELVVDINILTPPRRVASYEDIVIGRDGVILSKGKNQAVFLPQVAIEWKWDLDEMLTQLALKAGLKANEWRQGCKFDIFQSEEIS